jgi:hypothetical protein
MGSVLCPHCGEVVDCAELPAAANRATFSERIMPALAGAAQSADARASETEEGEEPVALAPRKARAPRRRSRQTIAVTGLAVAVLVLAAGALTYPLVRDHYNPWLTEKRWEQIQPGMTLQQLEAVLGKGKPCPQTDVKAAVDEQNAIGRNLMPFGPSPPDNWDLAQDIPNQAVRQRVTSWYRWRNGNTHLFLGVDSRHEVRLACLLRRPAGDDPGVTAWHFAVYPFGKGAVEPTGKSAEATLPEEKLVEQYIRKTAGNPGDVEIAGWGPHDLKGELRTTPGIELNGERRQRPVAKLRVRYWTHLSDGKPQPNDCLFCLQDGEVLSSYPNPYGDRWIDMLRDIERQLDRGR